MLSIGALASAAQGASYYERDGYYAKDDPDHRAASAWAGKGAEELGLKGPVDPDTFRAILEGRVPDGSDTRLGRRGKDGEILHRPGRDLTFSAPKSVSIAALVGGDDRIVEAHDRAVKATLAWVEKNAAETRMKDPETGRMGRVGGQKIVAATFRHDTSRNLDPQLHSHSVIANMVQGEDGKWRSMANEGLYARQKLIGMLYRNELAGGLARLGYGIEKTHADGRFEIAGVSREAVEAFSTRRRRSRARCPGAGRGGSRDGRRAGDARAGIGAGTDGFVGNTGCGDPGCRWPGRRRQRSQRGVRSGCLGDGASLRARGGVRPRRSSGCRARVCARHDRRRGGGTRGCRAGEGRRVARRGHARRRGFARHRPHRRRGTRDRGVHARGPEPRGRPDAGLASAGISQQGAAHGRAEGRREADPVGGGSRHRRAGLRRLRQDHHARPGAGARREEGLPHDRPRAVGVGGTDAGGGSRDRVRNPPDASSPAMRASPRAG